MTQRPRNAVSLHDVARVAGVSAQTVSRVANGSALVRPDTAERVRQAMELTGYRPNFAARALKRGRFHDIGVILFNITQTGNMLLLHGISAAAARQDYAVTLITLDGTDARHPMTSLDAAISRIAALPIDGAIIALENAPDDITTFAPPEDLPTVLITEGPLPHCATIDADQTDCSRQAVTRLLDAGHHTVHHIAGPSGSRASQAREQAWADTLRDHGVAPPEPLRGDWSADSGYDAGLRLANDPTCTAIYASNDQMAYGCMQALQDCGRRVPEDVSVIGVDDSLGGYVPRLQLTTMRIPFGDIGRTAFDMVMRACEGEHVPVNVRSTIPPQLIERGSVRDIAVSAPSDEAADGLRCKRRVQDCQTPVPPHPSA